MSYYETKDVRRKSGIMAICLFKTVPRWAVKMAQWVRTLAVLPEVLSLNPSNHITHSQPSVMRSDALFGLQLKTATVYLFIIINKSLGWSKQGRLEQEEVLNSIPNNYLKA